MMGKPFLSLFFSNNSAGVEILISSLLNMLFPEKCPNCDKPAGGFWIAPFCENCWKDIIPYKGPLCDRCGKPLSSEIAHICHECLKKEPFFVRARSFALYKGTMAEAINLFKYSGIRRLGRPLGRFFNYMALPQVDAIIPVPLHIRRLLHRGFNQSLILSKVIAKNSGRPVLINVLSRIRDTVPQVSLKAHERRKNVRGAFTATSAVKGKNLLLVDDVMTTGATTEECSRVLKKAGAKGVYVLTLARAYEL